MTGTRTSAVTLTGTSTERAVPPSTVRQRPPTGPRWVGTVPAAWVSAVPRGGRIRTAAAPGAVTVTPSGACWTSTGAVEPQPCERLSPRSGASHDSQVNVPPQPAYGTYDRRPEPTRPLSRTGRGPPPWPPAAKTRTR